MIQCPHCGNTAEFEIDAISYRTAYVTQHLKDTDWYEAGDLELDDVKDHSGTEWDSDSMTECGDCGYSAPLWGFDQRPIDASAT